MIRRLVSLLIAVPTALVGHYLLFLGGGMVSVRVARFVGLSDPLGAAVPIALTVLGAALVAVAIGTVAWSSLGAITVGAVQTLVGLLFVIVPLSFGSPFDGDAPFSPVGWVLRESVGLGTEFSSGLAFSLPTGFFLLIGLVILVIGLAARGRRRGPVGSPGLARIIALVVAIIALVPGVAMVAAGGGRTYRLQLQMAQGAIDPLGVALILAGVVIVAAVALGTRWSSLGVIVGGALLVLVGLFGIVLPVELLRTVGPVARGPEVQLGVQQLVVGNVLALGLVLLVGGIASAIGGRRHARRQSYVEPGTGPVVIGAGPYGQGPLSAGDDWRPPTSV